MSPFSGWVLGSATVVASPALWSAFVDGTMPLDVALTRYLISVAVSWLLISLVAEMAFPNPAAVKDQAGDSPAASESAEPDPPR